MITIELLTSDSGLTHAECCEVEQIKGHHTLPLTWDSGTIE